MPGPARLIARAVWAPAAAADCRRNAAACLPVLRRYGIENITSATESWWADDHSIAVLLEDGDSGEPLGGIRLQRWGGPRALPLERALAGVDARARSWVSGFAAVGVGELCGLWCSPEVRGFRLGERLTCMGIALATQARTQTLLALCDSRTVEANLRLGFRAEPTVASDGRFDYPRPGLVANVLRIDDAFALPSALPQIRALVQRYRSRPTGGEILRAGARRLELLRELEFRAPGGQAHRAGSSRASPPVDGGVLP